MFRQRLGVEELDLGAGVRSTTASGPVAGSGIDAAEAVDGIEAEAEVAGSVGHRCSAALRC